LLKTAQNERIIERSSQTKEAASGMVTRKTPCSGTIRGLNECLS